MSIDVSRARVYIAGGYPVWRAVRDVVKLREPDASTGMTHHGFVMYQGEYRLVGTIDLDAGVWYDLHISARSILWDEAHRLAELLACGIRIRVDEEQDVYRVTFIEDGMEYPRTLEGLKAMIANFKHDLALEEENLQTFRVGVTLGVCSTQTVTVVAEHAMQAVIAALCELGLTTLALVTGITICEL